MILFMLVLEKSLSFDTISLALNLAATAKGNAYDYGFSFCFYVNTASFG
jgi:hypothetical protein